MEVIDHPALASYLLKPDLPEESTAKVLDLTNRTISDLVLQVRGQEFTDIPVRVEAIALEVAARPVRAALPSSTTRASNDTSKTERYDNIVPDPGGVYLTGSERDELTAIAAGLLPAASTGAFTIRPGTRR